MSLWRSGKINSCCITVYLKLAALIAAKEIRFMITHIVHVLCVAQLVD